MHEIYVRLAIMLMLLRERVWYGMRYIYRYCINRAYRVYLNMKFLLLAAFITLFRPHHMPRNRQTFYLTLNGLWMSYEADRMFGW